MALKHKDYPLYGLQFHPESIGTKIGKHFYRNSIKLHLYQIEASQINEKTNGGNKG